MLLRVDVSLVVHGGGGDVRRPHESHRRVPERHIPLAQMDEREDALALRRVVVAGMHLHDGGLAQCVSEEGVHCW